MKKLEKYAPLLIAGLVVLNVLLLGFLLSTNRGDATTDPSLDKLTPTPTPTAIMPAVNRVATELGLRTPQMIEDVVLYAAPVHQNDTVAMIKLFVENGEVLGFIPGTGLIAMGSCEGNKTFASDRVCVDLAKTAPLLQGENLGTVKIKWGNNGRIYREEGDGYYNGQSTSLSVNSLNVNRSVAPGKVAGVTTQSTTDYSVEGVILIAASAIVMFTAGIGLYLNMHNGSTMTPEQLAKNENSLKIVVAFAMLVLTAAAVLVAITISRKNAASAGNANITPTPIYVTVTVPVTISSLPNTGGLTGTPTATPTVSPTVTITDLVTPTIKSPQPTPFTDNFPLVCGALDVNADRILNSIDYDAFARYYNHQCSDVYPHQSCGGKDTNEDGIVNYLDFYYLVYHMYPNVVDCTRY